MQITAFSLAERFVGLQEAAGSASSPAVLAMLRLDAAWPEGDDVPWCSAFINYVCWLLRLPRSKSLSARSWLAVGEPISLADAKKGSDIVVLSRGANAPGAAVLDAPGHVGFFAAMDPEDPKVVWVLGGNQGDCVSVAPFPIGRMLGVRRLS